MIWLVVYLIGLVLAWMGIHAATSKPSPRRALSNQSPNVAASPARGVLVLVEAPSTEVSGGGEVWDGADPTGPAPCP